MLPVNNSPYYICYQSITVSTIFVTSQYQSVLYLLPFNTSLYVFGSSLFTLLTRSTKCQHFYDSLFGFVFSLSNETSRAWPPKKLSDAQKDLLEQTKSSWMLINFSTCKCKIFLQILMTDSAVLCLNTVYWAAQTNSYLYH